nr:putative FAD/NAD(P)-binding domain protein [Tanacetum cinerariifolium]
MEEDDDKMVIIGAGICGLAMSLALHRKGIRSVVYEKSESLGNDTGAAIRVWKNGWRALDQLGVAHILRLKATLIKRDGEFRSLRSKDLIDTLCAAFPPTTVKLGRQLESIKLDLNTTTPVLRFTNGDSISAKVIT